MNIKKRRINKIIAVVLLLLLLPCASGCQKLKSGIKNGLGYGETITQRPTVRLTFPEGSTVAEFAKILEGGGVCTADEFLIQADNAALLTEYGFEIENPENRAFALEGYLFPDTYDFYVGEGAESAAKRFLENSQRKLDDGVKARCAELGYSLDDVLKIASIIQEEAGDPAEMGKVSSVIHNRLGSDSFPKLQCDAATFYMKDSVKPYVSEEEYELLFEAYSTYKCEGLPEGPITNCGIEAINAALYPEETDYYFFISDSENKYHYAETYEEHLEYCYEAGLI